MPDPNATAVLGSDQTQNTPPPTLASAPLARQVPPASPAQGPPQDLHSTLVGKVFKHVKNALEGTQTQYVPDTTPDGAPTGQVRPVQVPRKPGGIFRDILGGMLTGMAAGASPDHPSGAAGLGLGYVAAQNRVQQQDSQQRQRAQQQVAAQKAVGDQAAQTKQQNDLAAGAVAQQTMNVLHLGHNIGLHDDQEIDQHNNSMDVVKNEALKAGGQLAQVDENGKPGNGPALMAAFNKDPKLMQGPDGFHRIPFVSYDTNGLEHKDGQWKEKDGSAPDWNKRASVSLVDLPNAAWNKQVVIPRKSANDVAGREISPGKPTDSVSSTFGGLFSLGLKNIGQMNAEREERERGPADEKEAESWVAAGDTADKDSTNFDQIQKRATKGQAFLDAKAGTNLAGKAPTATGQKILKQNLEKALDDGSIKDPDRATLAQMEKDEAVKGVPGDIIAAIGDKPVPAEYPLGRKDPQYKADAKLWGDASLNKKTALSASQGLARYQMLGRIRAYNVVDTESGQMTEMNANQLADASEKTPGKFVLATQDGTKTMGKQAAVKDIQYNLDNTKAKIDALDDMDAATRAKLAVALRDTDPHSALTAFIQSGAGQTLNDKQQDAVIALNSMAENIMLLRAVQGIGGAGSDMMRNALINLVPSGKTPSKGYAQKQLSTVQRTLDQLKTGIPTVGRQSTAPVQPANVAKPDAAPPTNLLKEGIHTKFGNGQTWTLQNGKPVQVQ